MTALVAASSFTAIPEPVHAAKICPDIFMPVCAVNWHGVRKTYPAAATPAGPTRETRALR
ncbi:MAG: hypothetical protein ACREDY_22150 [Bradyrhizobium sp.]